MAGKEKMNYGYVYAMSNSSFKNGLIKIGHTKHALEKRAGGLFRTGVPEKFYVEFACSVCDYELAEKRVHQLFRSYRHNPKREFFIVDLDVVKKYIVKICKETNEEKGIYGSDQLIIIDNSVRKINSEDNDLDNNDILWVNYKKLILPTSPRSSLSRDQIDRLGIIFETLKEANKDSLSNWMLNLSMDENPEIEIKIYEDIVKEYVRFSKADYNSKYQKVELFNLLQSMTVFPKKDLKVIFKRNSLSSEQFDKILSECKLKIRPFGVS